MKSSDISSPARTIYDLARVTGLSKTTVSSALSGNGRIAPATRERVLEAARELQYEGNYYAQRLKKRCSKTVGLFSLDLDIGIETLKIKAIQRSMAKRGYDVPIYSYGSYGGGEEANQSTLMNTLRRQKPQAIICSLRGVERETLTELSRYAEEGGKVVCFGYLDQEVHDFDCVIFDEEDNTYQAVRHLLELGHREIGLYIPGIRRSEPRINGLRRAFAEFEVNVKPEWLFSTTELYDAGGGRMAQMFLNLKPRPSAMCIVNDHAASAFVNEVQRHGVRVPQDLSIVSHDNSPVAQYCAVPLTSVSHPVDKVAEKVVELLCSRLNEEDDGTPRYEIVRGKLVMRASTQAL